jgi:hypothetical protein
MPGTVAAHNTQNGHTSTRKCSEFDFEFENDIDIDANQLEIEQFSSVHLCLQ